MAIEKWRETKQAIYNLPDTTHSVRERFGNVVYDHLNDLHSNQNKLDNLEDLMDQVVKNPELGKRRYSGNDLLPY